MKTRVWHIQSLPYVCRLQFLSIFSSGKEEVQVPFRNSILLLVRVGHSEGAHPLNGQGGDCFLQLWDSLLGCAKSRQSCLTLCDPMDGSPPGSSVPGILQARILEWIAMPSSRGSYRPRDRTQTSDTARKFFII